MPFKVVEVKVVLYRTSIGGSFRTLGLTLTAEEVSVLWGGGSRLIGFRVEGVGGPMT